MLEKLAKKKEEADDGGVFSASLVVSFVAREMQPNAMCYQDNCYLSEVSLMSRNLVCAISSRRPELPPRNVTGQF